MDFVEKRKELLREIEIARHRIYQFEEKYPGFKKWFARNYRVVGLDKPKGFSEGNITEFKKDLNGRLEQIGDWDNHTRILQIKDFIRCSKLYETERKKETLDGRAWFLYYLEISQDSGIENPKLGRGLLIIHSKSHVVLEVPDKFSMPYHGEYAKITNNDNVYFFDLKSEENEKRLHIKITFSDANDAIKLGSYSTFDKRIYTGSLVLEQIFGENNNELDLKPCFISTDKQSELYQWVHPSIHTYLSVKSRNYHKVPQNFYPTHESLMKYLNKLRKVELRDVNNRFLEPEEPIIFFSAPQTTITGKNPSEIAQKKKLVVELLGNIKNKYGERFDVRYDTTPLEDKENITPLKSLKTLERTRFFILVLTETSKASFSLIELGWALGLCKHVFMIYQGNIISKKMEKFNELNRYFLRKKIDVFSKKDGISNYSDVSDDAWGFIQRHIDENKN